MTGRRPRRRARRGAHGTTLIELLVTLTLLATGFVALLTAFTQTELAVASTQADAQLADAARSVTDVVEAERPSGCAPTPQSVGQCKDAVPYIRCANGLSDEYVKDILHALVQRHLALPLGVAVVSVTVVQATSGSSTTANPAVVACSGGLVDYGVQQLHIQLTSAGHPLTRIVYIRWD